MKLLPIPLPAEPSGAVNSTAYLALEFIWRLKAYAAYYKIILAGSGFRTVYDQANAYLRYKNGGGTAAAFPGESWHNCGLAFDVAKDASGHYPATMPDDYQHKPREQALNVFGLCLPMWAGSAEKEPWHIIPIECLGFAGPDRQWFLDRDDKLNSASGFRVLRYIKLDSPVFTRSVLMRGNDVRIMQELLQIEPDGVFGPLTETAVTEFQKLKSLVPDGICGPDTWAALAVPDYQKLFEQQREANAALKQSISAELTALDEIISRIRGDLQ